MDTGIVILLALVVVYTLLAHRLSRISITMPIFFVVGGAIFGANGLGWITFSITNPQVEILTELTLALLLFADAATLEFRQVRDDAQLPERLLGIAFPLIVLAGALVCYLLFPSEKIGFALLLGSVLAPTDAALGIAIFNNPRVPVRIRRALNVESGLNDGMATPLVTLFIALLLEEMGAPRFQTWLFSALSEIAIALGVGVAIGLLGGWFFSLAVRKDWTSNLARQIGNPAIALLAFYLTKQIGGIGFVAAFTGGIFFGYATRHILHDAIEYTEVTGTFLSLFVWTMFGSAISIPLFLKFNPLALLYAILSLTLVRMIPVAIALANTKLRKDTKLVMGWLGPRGLASVVFLIIAYDAAHEAGLEPDLLVAAVGWTILLSVLLHGFSALPVANWYSKRLAIASPDIPELQEVPEPKTLRRKPFLPELLDRIT
jgi:NhaP-type Na+/H+ or K+/H+ antiporter